MVAGLDDVSLVGQVPKIVDEIHAADIIVVPLRAGGGTRLKIVEALACARPIVTTRIGAEGLALDDGETALLRDDADTFVDAVEALWNDENSQGRSRRTHRDLRHHAMRGKDSKRSSLDRLVRCFDERSRMSAARVLAFLDTGILSGPARQLIAAIPLLRERGYDVRPVVYQSGEARTDFRRALEAADIDYSVLHYGTRRDLLSGKLVEELIRKEGPRIIQTHNFRPAVGVSLSRRATRDLPWVAFYHGHTLEDWKVRVYNGIERILLQRSDVLVTVAERQRRRFPFARRLETIPNAVLPSARQGPSRRPAEARAGPILFLVTLADSAMRRVWTFSCVHWRNCPTRRPSRPARWRWPGRTHAPATRSRAWC